MATVRITGGTGDAGAIGDNRPWKLWAAVYQSDGTGGVITTRKDREANILRPVGGVLTFDVEAGIVVFLETPEGRRYSITTPEADGDLWALIEAAVAYPPETSQAALDAAVGSYVETNRAQFRTRAVPVDPEDPDTLYQWTDESGDAVGEPVALSEIVNVGSGSIADASASGLAVLTGDPAAGRETLDVARRTTFNVREFGATGDGVSDDTAALAAAFAAAAAVTMGTRLSTVDGTTDLTIRGTVEIPDGTFLTSEPIMWPAGVNIVSSANAKIRASATIGDAGVITSAVGQLLQQQTLMGGLIVDCAGLADYGFDLRYFAYLDLDVRVWSPAVAGIVAGSDLAVRSSYGLHTRMGTGVWRPKGITVPEGSMGLWLRRCTDCEIWLDPQGCDIGVQNDSGSNNFYGVHPWCYDGQGSVGFADSAGDAQYIGCTADTPAVTGWRFQPGSSGGRLIGCKAIMSPNTGSDAIAYAVQYQGTGQTGSLLGFTTRGGDASHRFAATIDGDITAVNVIDLVEANVVTLRDPMSFRGHHTKTTLALRPGTGVAPILEQHNLSDTQVFGLRAGSDGALLANQLGARRLTKTANYTIASSDPKLLAVTSTSSPVTITLPSASAVGAGAVVTIKDESGGAGTNNITVSRAGSDTIEGATTAVISTNYGAVQLYSNGSGGWFRTT